MYIQNKIHGDIARYIGMVISACVALLLISLLTGCAATGARVNPPEITKAGQSFTSKIDTMIEALTAAHHLSAHALMPAAVMPATLKSGGRYTRLEEFVLERLAAKLRKTREMVTLSRQNWFEYREGRALRFSDNLNHLKDLVIYELKITPMGPMETVGFQVTGTLASGRSIPGLVAETTCAFGPFDPARDLFERPPLVNPLPKGLEERPYDSVDQLMYSLSAELTDAGRKGLKAGRQVPAAHEIRVQLFASKPPAEIPEPLFHHLIDTLQQDLVSHPGVTCTINRRDLGPVLEQITFYEKQRHLFNSETAAFPAGTVLLQMDTFAHSDRDKIGVALRAVWRVGPLETASGNLIETETAGTYVTGFTAKAYLQYHLLRKQRNIAPIAQPTHSRQPAPLRRPAKKKDILVTFFNPPARAENNLYTALKAASGAVEIIQNDCAYDARNHCVCFKIPYSGSMGELGAGLSRRLRRSSVAPIRWIPANDHHLNIWFDTGFE